MTAETNRIYQEKPLGYWATEKMIFVYSRVHTQIHTNTYANENGQGGRGDNYY